LWNLPHPPGFEGLREDRPLTFYERHLPHWRQDGATYFVTFRLADSLPHSKLDELARIKLEWERTHPPPRSKVALEEWARMSFERVEFWLDQGFGDCILRNEQHASRIIEALHYFDDSRYELDGYVVMPNHVHVVLRPVKPAVNSLEKILGSWKSYSSRRINTASNQQGAVWQDESHDRIIRDEEHLWRALRYIGRNLERSGFPRDSQRAWIRPEWESLGWTVQ
jgi:putative transposase